MTQRFEEIVQGEAVLRQVPDSRHELICGRLHETVGGVVEQVSSTRLLGARSVVELASGTLVRPDLTLVAAATGKPWLIAEIVNTLDHRVDTVMKKMLYEEMNLPRLWMIDPRYDNVEVYHGGQYGLALKHILAGKEALTEQLLPSLEIRVRDLFA